MTAVAVGEEMQKAGAPTVRECDCDINRLETEGAPVTNEELLQELEALVVAMEDSLAVIAGTICETSDPRRTLMNLCAGRDAIRANHGANEWRDRLLRSALKISALKARSKAAGDPTLQSLIASVLGEKTASESTH